MTQATEKDVLNALSRVVDPILERDIISANRVRNLTLADKALSFTLVSSTPAEPLNRELKESVRSAISDLEGIDSTTIQIEVDIAQGGGMSPSAETLVPGAKNIIAVASGKGGVGKSTVSVNLSIALASWGAKVGLLDADFYGPNIPLMMGIKERPSVNEAKITPLERYGVRVMSMGFLLPDDDSPVIWRGPIINSALTQLFKDVDWGELDYLILDLPPGTGDVQISLVQLVPLTGAVVVTTPQDVALQDVAKAIAMFKKTNVRQLGMVENMSFFLCPKCGERAEIFGHGGGERAAEKYAMPFLGRVPLDPSLREGGDSGTPITVADPSSPNSQAFFDIAANLTREVAKASASSPKRSAGLKILTQ